MNGIPANQMSGSVLNANHIIGIETKSEKWKPIKGWEGLYEVSDIGRVRSIKRIGKTLFGLREYAGGIVKPFLSTRGSYPTVNLTKRGKRVQLCVHVIVLMAFVGVKPQNMQGCHNNGIKADNSLDNLRWDTSKNNHNDMEKHGTIRKGEAVGTSKLTEKDVLCIRQSIKSAKKLATQFKVSITAIRYVLRNETWKHI